jgi:hypothetical protein
MSAIITKDADGFERIVFGEVLIPDQPNVYGDYHSRQSVREFAYGFARLGFGLNVEHDNPDVLPDGRVTIVESFIAREGDPDFIPGAWVLGVWIHDDAIWRDIRNGKLQGFSYEAMVRHYEFDLIVPDETAVYGVTQPDLDDGHVHEFYVLCDIDGRVIAGGTSYADDHEHTITHHTFTDPDPWGRVHPFQLNEAF